MRFLYEHRLLRQDSRPISASFYRFGCRPIRSDMVNTDRFGVNHLDSVRIGASSSHVDTSRRESWKKKEENTWQDAARRGTNARATASLARRLVGPCQTRVRLLWHRVRASQVLSSKIVGRVAV